MASYYVPESFFRPPLVSSEDSSIPAPLYNTLKLLLVRHERDNLFIAIRSMQYLAVVVSDEVIFVDGAGGYAVQDGEGGRLIRIAWQPAPQSGRESLDRPVPCQIRHYFPDQREVQRRLMSEFPPVLQRLLQKQRDSLSVGRARVVPFRRPEPGKG